MAIEKASSSSTQNLEKLEVILILVDTLSAFGFVLIFLFGISNMNSSPNAFLISLSGISLLTGFIFDRGGFSAQMSSRVQEKVWWIGPITVFSLLLLGPLIEGTLLLYTLIDIGQLALIAGAWIVGAGLKRLLVRGRLLQAYRNMITKSEGTRNFRMTTRMRIGILVVLIAILLFAFFFDNDNFRRILSSTVFFFIITMVCFPLCLGESKKKGIESQEFDTYVRP